MAGVVERVIMCPICLDTMTKPILQCKTGHSMCGDCIKANSITSCPQCRGPITETRNFQLEQMIESMKDIKTPCFFAPNGCRQLVTSDDRDAHEEICKYKNPPNTNELKVPCIFADRGCKYLLTPSEKDGHEAECKNRKFLCEGRKFAKWKCHWFGSYTELEEHFKSAHGNYMEYKMQKDMIINLDKDYREVQIISFFNGAQYFWYKHMVDVIKERVYWTFQFIGPQKQARNYYYEFEISNGPIRKFKVTEICDNDAIKAENLFKEEKCVVLSFSAVKTYLNDKGKLPVKFRIMNIKKPNELSR